SLQTIEHDSNDAARILGSHPIRSRQRRDEGGGGGGATAHVAGEAIHIVNLLALSPQDLTRVLGLEVFEFLHRSKRLVHARIQLPPALNHEDVTEVNQRDQKRDE